MSDFSLKSERVELLDEDPSLPTLTLVEESPALSLVRPGLLRRVLGGLASALEGLLGVGALLGGLALLSVTPVLQFLTLGYFLEAGGRVARSGRLRDGFIGVRRAARVGGIVAGIWLLLLPLRFLGMLARSAQLIDPEGPVARRWAVGLTTLTILVGLHIGAACSRGGKLRYFLWPFGNPVWLLRRLWRGGYYAEARDVVWHFVTALRLPYYFWLGLRGFAGSMLWLTVPILLLAVGRQVPPAGFLGAILFATVIAHLPFLQMRFVTEHRFRALFEVRAVRERFRRAPWAFALALFTTLAFALPLYLLKIEMVPREIGMLVSLVFLVFVFPTRLLSGWAYHRAARGVQRSHWFFRWTGRLWMLPTVAVYTLIVFFTQYTAWNGLWSLFEQHAFLVPVPFMSL